MRPMAKTPEQKKFAEWMTKWENTLSTDPDAWKKMSVTLQKECNDWRNNPLLTDEDKKLLEAYEPHFAGGAPRPRYR